MAHVDDLILCCGELLGGVVYFPFIKGLSSVSSVKGSNKRSIQTPFFSIYRNS